MQNKKSAFTLVELIATITILAVLRTIGFMSFQNYTVSARDTQRTSDLKTLEKWLQAWITTKSAFPLPDQSRGIVTIYASGSSNPVAYQGYVGADVLRAASFNGSALDPSTGNPYTYSVSATQGKFQLLALTEAQAMAFSLADQAYASAGGAYAQMVPYALGTPVGAVLGTASTPNLTENQPAQDAYNPASFTGIDIAKTNTEYAVSFPGARTVKGTGAIILSARSAGAKNCLDLLGLDPLLKGKDGTYYVNLTGTKTIPVFCDMTKDGGGWTLVSADLIQSGSGLNFSETIETQPDSGVKITVTPLTVGCWSGAESYESHTVAKDIPWTKIRYTQEFYGKVSCWNVFGSHYAEVPNLQPFRTGVDVIRDASHMNSLTNNAFDGTPWRCDNLATNFWHGNNGSGLRSATVILEKADTTKTANLHTHVSCVDLTTTKWSYKNVFVR